MAAPKRFLLLLSVVLFVLPYLLQNAGYEPHRDEFLYLAEGAHPAFGFMEVPPLLSVFARLTAWFGGGMFWIKCWPALFGAANLYLVGRILLSLGGGLFSVFLLFLGFVFSSLLRVHFLFQPNFLEVFFYTGIAFSLVRYVQTGKNSWLYFAGAAAGLGLLSKYSIAMYIVSLGLGLALSRQRTIFRNPHLFYAASLGLLIFLPNFLWQYLHHFPVVHHMQELKRTQLQYVSPAGFLVDQLLMFFPCFFLWVTGLCYLLFTRAGKPYFFLGVGWLGVIAILLWFHGKNYYAIGLYPVLLGFGAVAIERWTAVKRRALRYVVAVVIIIPGTWFLFLSLPLLPPAKLAATYRNLDMYQTGAMKWEDLRTHPLPQDFADMLGWEELARKTAGAYRLLDSTERGRTFLFANNYGTAGALTYYGPKYGLPPAYSDNASFLYWIPDTLQIHNFILITDDTMDIHRGFAKAFIRARVIDSVSVPFAREQGNLILLLEGANADFRRFFRAKIAEDRRELGER